jgi:hypothetical protein
MKRDECNMSAGSLCEHDARQLAIFELELGLLARFRREGHSQRCAKNKVWGDGCVCICTEPRDG